MEKLKKRYRDMSLRQSFVLTVLATFGTIALLSGMTIGGCLAFQRWLLPDADSAFLTIQAEDSKGDTVEVGTLIELNTEADFTQIPKLYKYDGKDGEPVREYFDTSSLSVKLVKLENSLAKLTPKRKLAYQGCWVLMVAVPLLLSAGGILFCGFSYYRHKLYYPLKALSEATEQIAEKNLDFKVAYESEDELGKLCRSFEQMRQVLYENNRQLWKMIEERKLVQASVAHDLRNPIAIIQGYTEYLQIHLYKEDMARERIAEIADNIGRAAGRLEQYTESIRKINQLDDMEIHREEASAEELAVKITEDLSLMASEQGKKLLFTGRVPEGAIFVDVSILYRILENLLNNALRYAKETIELSFEMRSEANADSDSGESLFVVTLADDGEGFPEAIQKSRNRLLPATEENGHCGMGLTISRLLCQKHGGRLELANRQPHGAVAKVLLEVS